MNTAQVLGYPLLLISVLELFLGLLLLKQNRRKSIANRAAAACAFFAAVWSMSTSLMYIRFSLGLDSLLFDRVSWIGWFTVPAALRSVFFLKDERSREARLVGVVLYPFWTVVLGLCLFTDLIVTPAFVLHPYTQSFGPLEMPIRLIGGLMTFWLIYVIVRVRRQVSGYRRAQLSYYLYGTAVFATGEAVVAGFLQLFTGRGLEPSLNAYFSLPWILMIFFAFTRHRLFDIRLIISRTLIILILSFCISAIQFVLYKFLEPVIGPVATIFISVPIIGIIFFGTPLSRNVQTWINDLVLRGRYQYQDVLKESTQAMVTILDRDELLRFVIDIVRRGFGVGEVFLYLLDADGRYAKRHCHMANGEIPDGCVLPDNVVACLTDTGEPIISDELAVGLPDDDVILPETVRRMGVEVVLPLTSQGRLLGALTLNKRSSGEPYLQGDIDALQTLAGQIAVAIENIRLFDEAVQARASLKESENIFRTLAETSNAAILIFRPNEFIYANQALARMSGYTVRELQAANPYAFVHEDYREMMIKRGKARLRGEEVPPQYEFKFIHRDGSERWAITSSAALELRTGKALLATIVDITELKHIEEERARLYEENVKYYRERIAEQERFAAALSTTREGFWICGSDVRFTFVNDAYCTMLGYSREELLTMSIKEVELIESAADVDARVERIKLGGNDLFETKHRRRDGSQIDLEITVSRFKDEETFFCFGRDITDRKKAEEALRRSDERFRQVSDTAQEWIWEVDADGRYTYSSPVVMALLGYHPDEVVGKHYFFDFFIPEEREPLKKEAFKVFAAKTIFRDFVNRNLNKDGREVVLSTSGIPILDEQGNLQGYRGVDFDISERIRAEQERRQFYEESLDHYEELLKEQERHQAEKEKILKDLHDGIGGITTNIKLLAELAQKQDELSAVKRSLATIADLSQESLSEIRSFIQSLDEKELSWQAMAAEFRSLGNTIIVPHGITFSLDAQFGGQAGGPTSTVSMNLFRIYKESLANVIKHAKATAVGVRFSVEGGRASLEVRDNGIGLDGKRAGGRGLVNMKNRALEIGGNLSVTTDKGTLLRLDFPIP